MGELGARGTGQHDWGLRISSQGDGPFGLSAAILLERPRSQTIVTIANQNKLGALVAHASLDGKSGHLIADGQIGLHDHK